MKISTTAILALVVIVLGFAIRLVDREPVVGEGAAERARVLVRFSIDGVDRVSIERGPSRTEIVSRGGQWFFAEPEQDRVNADAMEALLDDLNHLARLDRIEPGEEMKPVELGIEGDAAIRVEISGETEEGEAFSETVVLGGPAPRSDSLYAKRAGEDVVHVVDGNPRGQLENPLETLRDPRVLSAPVEAIVQLGMRRPSGEWTVQRRIVPPKQDWVIVSPLRAWAGVEEMDELLADLAALTIAEVQKDQKIDESIPEPLPEKSAVLQFRVFGFEQPLTLYLEEVEAPPVEGAPALVEVRVSDRPFVYRLRSRILETLPDDANGLRTRTLARIPTSALNAIYVESLIDPAVQLRSEKTETGLRWRVRINDKLLPANQGEVNSLVEGINEARILEFVSDSARAEDEDQRSAVAEELARYGLDRPERRITFQMIFPGQPDEEGNPGDPTEVVRSLRLGWGDEEARRLYAWFEGEPYIYEVDPSLLTRVPSHPIKWKSLSVLTYSPFSLRSINREVDGRGKLTLKYDYKRDAWEATRNGVDVTPTLDPASARRLSERLGDLKASGWYLSLASAYEALQEPSAEFEIVTSELDRATGEAAERTYRIRLAKSGIVIPPSSEPLYFGQIVGSPDVFFIDHETYGNLIRPVTGSSAR